jgi:alkylation response protein AidB-like acyl-CoA dehydrogenase
MEMRDDLDAALSGPERGVVARARAFAREHVAPRAVVWERGREHAGPTVRLACREGLAGLLLPERHGGLGLGLTAAARVFEELGSAHLPFAFSLVVHANLVRGLGRLGDRAQIETHVPALLTGDQIGAFCLTEPGAGSDAAAIVTRATPEGGGWRLHGEKAWVTNGVFADLACVYAQSDPSLGARGVVALLVSAGAPGVERLPAEAVLGGHAMGTAGLRFTGCRVGDTAVLAPPGRGFAAAMVGIDVARVLLGAMCCGVLRDSLEHAVRYASTRRAFGRAIAEFQGLQWSLADVATELAAARALTYETARTVDASGEAGSASAHTKKFTTAAALRGVTACMRAMGAVALRDEHPLGRHLAAAQIAEYLDGTTGIQNVVITRSLFGRPSR